MKLACPECAHRQSEGARCGQCGYDGLLDLDNARHVELLRDIDRRARDRRSDRTRKAAVAFAMIIVFALWLVPGYWHARGRWYPGLPLLADQWLLIIGIAAGLWKLLDMTAPPPKFPYVDDDGSDV